MQAHLLPECFKTIMNSLAVFKEGKSRPLKCFQRAMGLMAAASMVWHLGLLQMPPFQLWLKIRVPVSVWHAGSMCILVTCRCLETLAPWMDPALYAQGVPLGQICERKVHDICFMHRLGSPLRQPSSIWHLESRGEKNGTNCLELKAVHLASHACSSHAWSHPHGQHVSDSVYKSPGRHSLSSLAHDEHDTVGRSASLTVSRSPYPWPPELRGGHVIQAKSDSGRVETSPPDREHDLECIRMSRGRPFRIRGEHSLSEVFFHD